MRLIDLDVLLSDIETTIENSGCVFHEDEIMDCVKYAPTIDAVPVVRCGKCSHYNTTGFPALNTGTGWCEKMGKGVSNEFYCSYGAKMDGGK